MSKLSFRIVENPAPRVDMEELKKDYLNPMMDVDDICKKHDISRNYYLKLRKDVVKETGVSRKPTKVGARDIKYNKSKNISRNPFSGKYRVTHFQKGKARFFGNYDTFEIAEEVRDLLIEHNWSRDYYRAVIRPKYNPSLDLSTPDGFEEDFCDPSVSMDDLKKKYGLSQYQYRMISSVVKQKYGLFRKPRKVTP